MSTHPVSSAFGNRYIVEDLLGEGGMGAVYRAKDRLTGHKVAVKRVHESDSTDLMTSTESGVDAHLALAQEFQILSSLRHPNIIGVLDYGFDEERQPYYVMDVLVDAPDIRSAARDKPLDTRIDYLVQMLQALAYLHRRGIIHRDLKPANVLVKDEQVKVLDFGFATLASQAQIGTAGTLKYLAPEIFSQQPASVASDLYAVGIIAYELLAGQYPFNADDITTLIQAIMATPPDLSLIGGNSRLRAIVGRLLAKNPQDRYGSAQQVIVALCAAAGLPTPEEDTAIRDSFLQAAPLIGRDAELAILTGALAEALDGKGECWLIGGESGVGKSRLVNEVATLALIRGALVVRGNGIQEGARPFQVWRDPLRRLVLATDVSDAEAAVLKELLPEIGGLLERPIPETPPLDSPSAQQARLVATILAVLRRQNQPIVVILDDLQWAGEESLALLRQLNAVIADRPILVIANYRDDERPDLISVLPDMQQLKLRRLSAPQIAELSAAMLGESGRQPEIVAFLERETEGNVFFLIEVVRALAEEAGQLTNIAQVELPAHLVVGGIQRIIERRLSRLPPQALPRLQAAAVFGREIDLAILAAIDGTARLQNWLVDCANAAVLEVQNERWQFAHDKLRQGVLATLSPEQRREHHAQVGRAIEAVYPDVPTEAAALAYHWGMAGDTAKEALYSRLAGEQARRISNGHEAITFFKRSLELTSDARARANLMASIAVTLFWLGEFGESRQYNLDAIAIGRELGDQKIVGTALSSLGNTAIQQGQYAEATSYHQETLKIARATHDSEMTSHALSGLGDIAWRTEHYHQAMRYLQRNLVVAQRLDNSSLRGNALNMLGIVYAMQGQLQRAGESFQESLAIAQQTGDRSRIAQSLSNLGEVALTQKDYAAATTNFEQALALSREAGNRYSIGNIQVNLGMIALASGQPEQARDYFLSALQNARHIESELLMLAAVGGLACLEAQGSQKLQAVELIGLIMHHPASSPDLQATITQAIYDALKRDIPTELFAAALERGERLDLRTTVESFLCQER